MVQHLIAGRDNDSGRIVTLPENVRSTHLHVLGASGRGKSKFLEHMIRSDIQKRHGLCLIDPHGSLYADIVKWCVRQGLASRRKLLLIEPSNESWSFAFNPLALSGLSPRGMANVVDGMVGACAQVWGGEDQHKTPRMARILPVVFRALAENGLTLREALDLCDSTDDTLRRYLASRVTDELVRYEWDELNALTQAEFRELIESTRNRLYAFFRNPQISTMMGQGGTSLDFKACMEDGAIVLVNLGGFQPETKKLLGALMLNSLYHAALSRDTRRPRPFYTYLDECHYFLTGDVDQILTECRKFGLHLILAHQNIGQLRRAGDAIATSIMQVANKVVFGGINPPEDAEEVATQIFMGTFELEESKKTLERPVVTGYVREWLESHSSSEGMSEGESHFAEDEISERTGESWGMSEASAETLVPVLEWMPTSVYSFQEQVYRAMALMVNQPTQRAYLKVSTKPPIAITTPTITDPIVGSTRVKAFREHVFEHSPIARPRKRAEKEVTQRRQRLVKDAHRAMREKEPEDFFE